ncbi:MAG: hypothetical protein IJA34_15960 [Lachnospiraceae bacterium]|nr:hypothetical protein [Lachnospiraceae bacterium]
MKELKTRKQNLDKNIYLNLMVFAIGIVAILFTPFIARIFSPLFNWVGYGSLLVFWDEVFTSVFWFAEIAILKILYKKRFDKNIISNPETKGQELPIKRVFIITGIVIACILIISVQIGFQVKPFYDLGKKFNGYELLVNCGVFLVNIIKCMWITIMLKAVQDVFEEIIGKGKMFIPFAGLILLLTLGIYDVITGAYNLPETYLVLYAVYGLIYLLTDRHMIKTYLLIMFICLF